MGRDIGSFRKMDRIVVLDVNRRGALGFATGAGYVTSSPAIHHGAWKVNDYYSQ